MEIEFRSLKIEFGKWAGLAIIILATILVQAFLAIHFGDATLAQESTTLIDFEGGGNQTICNATEVK